MCENALGLVMCCANFVVSCRGHGGGGGSNRGCEKSVFVKLETVSKTISSYWVMLGKKLNFIVDSMYITALLLEYTVLN